MSIFQPITVLFIILIIVNPYLSRLLTNYFNLNIIFLEIVINIIIISLFFLFRNIFNKKEEKSVINDLKIISNGDYRNVVNISKNSIFFKVADLLNKIMTGIRKLFKNSIETSVEISEEVNILKENTNQVYKTTEEITNAVNEVAQGAEKQSLNLENTNQEIDKILNFINKTFKDTKEVAQTSKKASDIAQNGNKSIKELINRSNNNKKIILDTKNAMNKLEENFKEMTEITGAIEKVSNQTALLALNASIEAARAGDAGKGFGVLAREIRDFSLDVDKLVDEINEVMGNVDQQIISTVKKMDENVEIIDKQDKETEDLGEKISNLYEIVTKNYEKINDLKDDTGKVNKIIDNTKDSFGEILSISQQTAANSQEVTASIENQQIMLSDIEKKVNLVDQKSQNLRNFFASKAMDETMINLCNKIKKRKQKEELNNKILKEIRDDSNIDEIYIVSKEGEFIKSTIDSILGANLFEINEWAKRFVKDKNVKKVITPIHRRIEDNKLYKFVMIRDLDGKIIEVGLSLESLV